MARRLHDATGGTSVREAIRARASRLRGAARDALVALCVLDVPCRAQLAAQLLNGPSHDVLAALEELLERQLARVDDHGEGYTVEHPLVRRVVYEDLSPGRRQHWHRRVADVLSNVHARDIAVVAGTVFRHLLAADASTDELLSAGRLAGETALRQYAFTEAADYLRIVHARLAERRSPSGDSLELTAVTESLADALHGCGHWESAIAHYEAALATIGDPLGRARLCRKLGEALYAWGSTTLRRQPDQARAVLAEALERARSAGARPLSALITDSQHEVRTRPR